MSTVKQPHEMTLQEIAETMYGIALKWMPRDGRQELYDFIVATHRNWEAKAEEPSQP